MPPGQLSIQHKTQKKNIATDKDTTTLIRNSLNTSLDPNEIIKNAVSNANAQLTKVNNAIGSTREQAVIPNTLDAVTSAKNAAENAAISAKIALDAVKKLPAEQQGAAKAVANSVQNTANEAASRVKVAQKAQGACSPDPQPATVTTTKTSVTKLNDDGSIEAAGDQPPVAAAAPASTNYTFNRKLFPLWHKGCDANNGAAVLAYFAVDKSGVLANRTQYLYNAKQSTNAINADLFTGTFPGFQVVLAGTATAGSSQTANPTGMGTPATSAMLFEPRASTTAATSTPQTDSVQAAVAKLEQGGDFNVRFPAPIARKIGSVGGFDVKLMPNIGFMVDGLTGQNTVTESTEYALNIPLEAYFELGSYEKTAGISNVVLYGDFKPGAEVISPGLKSAIGLTSNRYFFLGQASIGVELMNSVRMGVQYFLGPSQLYASTNATGIGTTQTTDHVGGFHLVVSFSPSSNKPKGS